jgi:hypothetical protein
MNEPTKQNPKTSKRSKRRPAMEPLGWDEIVSQPGMGGYLSFLNGPVPLPHLQGPATGLAPDPGVVSHPGADPMSSGVDISPELLSTPESVLTPEIGYSPCTETTPDIETSSGPVSTPESSASLPPSHPFIDPAPEVVTIPVAQATQRLRVRRCSTTYDGHSLGEEVLYQALWKAANPESAEIRTIVIGWRGMSQLCRMTPKNCKINTQRLIRKLALEVLSPYNTPESIGTTYRVYSDQAILQRRREVGLEWVVRSRGVEFVDPATGIAYCPSVHIRIRTTHADNNLKNIGNPAQKRHLSS